MTTRIGTHHYVSKNLYERLYGPRFTAQKIAEGTIAFGRPQEKPGYKLVIIADRYHYEEHTHVWTTTLTKRKIPLREMATNHIKRCLATLKGRAEPWKSRFSEELKRRDILAEKQKIQLAPISKADPHFCMVGKNPTNALSLKASERHFIGVDMAEIEKRIQADLINAHYKIMMSAKEF